MDDSKKNKSKLTKEQISSLPTLQSINDELTRKSLHYFLKTGWKNIVSAEFVDGWHIRAICDHLEAVVNGQIRNLIINIPPRHCKSLLVSVFFPAWLWLSHPEKKFLYASYAQSLSMRDSVYCRALIESDWYRRLRNFSLLKDQNTKSKFENDKHGARIATSVGGTVTGEGGDYLIVDDPLNAGDSHSEAMREASLEWWNLSMSTRLNDPNTGCKIIICQRIHEKDLVGHILEDRSDEWEKLVLPCEFVAKDRCTTSIGFSDPRKEDNELIWPSRFSRKFVNNLKKTLGVQGASAQLQQKPTPDGGSIIRIDWIKEYEVLPDVISYTWSWDTAIKVKEKNDYSVGILWAKCKNGYYLVDIIRKKMKYPELKKTVIFCYERQRSGEVLIEDKSSGQQLLQEFESLNIPVIRSLPTIPKYERLKISSSSFEAGKVYIPKSFPLKAEYVKEIISFPNAAHDDTVDATSQYLLREQSQTKKFRLLLIG